MIYGIVIRSGSGNFFACYPKQFKSKLKLFATSKHAANLCKKKSQIMIEMSLILAGLVSVAQGRY